MALHRTAIVSCSALIALMLAAALLVRGGGGAGPFHVIETVATPTVEVAGLPSPPVPAARAERADLGQLATTSLTLLLLSSLAVLVTLLGVIGAETLARRGRRVIEVMLGAPPRRLVGAAARVWRIRLAIAGALGVALCTAGVVWLVGIAPPGTGFRAPAIWLVATVPVLVAGVVFAAGLAPVRRLYARGRALPAQAASRQYTDPRPQQFNRILLVTAQLAVAVAILASSGLLVLSSAGRPELPGPPGAGAVEPATGRTVVGRLVAEAERGADAPARAATYESALAALRDAPLVVAESLSTPGAWLGRGPEVVAVNECGPCTAGGMPRPIQRARVQVHAVMPGFFEERGMRFLAGGGFAEPMGDAGDPVPRPGPDPGTAPRAVVINRAYAAAHFIDPVGRHLHLRNEGEEVWYDVVGVVEDAPRGGLGNSGSPYAVYYSALEHPPDEVELVATVEVPPSAGLDDSLRVVRQALDATAASELVMSDFRRADDEVARVHGTAGWLGGGMRAAGVLAGLVALVGVTATLRAHIRSRLREMGIRAALGAAPRALRRMVVREALRLAVAGTGLGLWAATFLVAFLSPNAVDTFSLPLFLGVAALFVGSAVLVALPNARLAASADPRHVMDERYQSPR